MNTAFISSSIAVLILFQSLIWQNSTARPSSYPYIAGDTFRAIANFILDETNLNFNPKDVKNGDIIFLKIDYLEFFFINFHPQIDNKYILITHNGDYSAPGKFAHMLDDEKLIMWFGQNSDINYHPKFYPIPIGIANQYAPHGNVNILNRLIAQYKNAKKDKLLYMNFAPTNHAIRAEVQRKFEDKIFCYKASKKSWPDYLIDLATSIFVLSPHGNGLDCHRTWEALLMGSFPIVKSSTLDRLYKDLPVVIIKNWDEITEDFLVKKYEELISTPHDIEKAYASYWLHQIQNCRKDILK